MRGNPKTTPLVTNTQGSIPAYAGEPMLSQGPGRMPRVYPRVCGGTAVGQSPTDITQGLSPRMRGNRAGAEHVIDWEGSIPAYAGEPRVGH